MIMVFMINSHCWINVDIIDFMEVISITLMISF